MNPESPMSTTSFKDKTVIITGASAGVGAACARLFARHGAKLVLVARGEKALNNFADTLRGQTKVMTVDHCHHFRLSTQGIGKIIQCLLPAGNENQFCAMPSK